MQKNVEMVKYSLFNHPQHVIVDSFLSHFNPSELIHFLLYSTKGWGNPVFFRKIVYIKMNECSIH